MTKFLITFVVLSLINVIFSTIKSITTIKSGKNIASLISGLYYGYYNIVLIYTVADFPMWQKCLTTFVCNLIGVWVVKYAEEKARKDKLWLVKVTVPREKSELMLNKLKDADIPNTWYDLTKYYVFDCYCQTQAETAMVARLCHRFNGKMFATENKISC